MKSFDDQLKDTQDLLATVSPSMCMAKWSQVTLHLYNGTTHSCHHPLVHKIPLELLKDNPSAIHNTPKKKEARKQMLAGERPPECVFCWNLEDCGRHSDRHYKSADPTIASSWQKILDAGWEGDINPSYIEVNFSHKCNLKCMYCNPYTSSSIEKEIKEYGEYNLFNKDGTHYQVHGLYDDFKTPIPMDEHNPYIDAFWRWWPDMYKDLRILRLSGGEPFLSKDTMLVLERLLENPNPELELAINSNLCVPDKLIDRAIVLLKELTEKKCIKKFQLFTSVDTAGDRAEYIRTGLNYAQWKKNVYKFLEAIPELSVGLMCTYNLMSVYDFQELMVDVLEIKQKFFDIEKRYLPISVDFPYLLEPELFSMGNLTHEFLPVLEKSVKFVEQWQAPFFNGAAGFGDFEYDRIKTLYECFKTQLDEPAPDIKIRRASFFKYVIEKDRRHGTDFYKTFPEYKDWFDICKQEYLAIKIEESNNLIAISVE